MLNKDERRSVPLSLSSSDPTGEVARLPTALDPPSSLSIRAVGPEALRTSAERLIFFPFGKAELDFEEDATGAMDFFFLGGGARGGGVADPPDASEKNSRSSLSSSSWSREASDSSSIL